MHIYAYQMRYITQRHGLFYGRQETKCLSFNLLSGRLLTNCLSFHNTNRERMTVTPPVSKCLSMNACDVFQLEQNLWCIVAYATHVDGLRHPISLGLPPLHHDCYCPSIGAKSPELPPSQLSNAPLAPQVEHRAFHSQLEASIFHFCEFRGISSDFLQLQGKCCVLSLSLSLSLSLCFRARWGAGKGETVGARVHDAGRNMCKHTGLHTLCVQSSFWNDTACGTLCLTGHDCLNFFFKPWESE